MGADRINTDYVKANDDVFIADSARVIGNVKLGSRVSIWFGTVVRGDMDEIIIGDETNIQDEAVLHVDTGFKLCIGKRVTVGHGAVLHGCTVEDGALIGMNAVVLNGAVVEKGAVVGAGSLVREGQRIPAYSLAAGSPAKVIRQMDENQVKGFGSGVNDYLELAEAYLKRQWVGGKRLSDKVVLEISSPVATVTLKNPPLNVLSTEVREQLYSFFMKIQESKDVRLIILQGSGGRAFSVGSDIKEFPFAEGKYGGREKARFEQMLHDLLESLPQVTVASLEGHTLGGGLELALACDLRVASDDCKLGFPEVNIGAFPCSGGTMRLARLVGASRAKQLMFWGDSISAGEALEMGLVNMVYQQGEKEACLEKVKETLLSKPYSALVAIKRCINASWWSSMSEGSGLEANLFGKLFVYPDLKEGINAFIEKRRPKFSHKII